MTKAILFIKIPSTNTLKEEAMEKFLHALHRIMPSKSLLSLEMASSQQFLRFYIVTTFENKSNLESQLYAQYPQAEIEEVEDYLPSSFENVAIAQLDFKKPSHYPIRTYEELEENYIKLLSALLSKCEANEEAYIQLTLKKVGSKLLDRGVKGAYIKLFLKKEEGEAAKKNKFSEDLYMGKLRIAYKSDNIQVAEQKLGTLINLLKSLKGQNELRKQTFFMARDLRYVFKGRTLQDSDFWSTREIATIFHFPYEGSLVSNVVSTTSRRAPAPDILPVHGSVAPKEVSFVGQTNYRNDKKIFGLKRIDRRRHLYVIGKTGSGKSKLLELLLISDIKDGHGCCIIDPHGDLALEILKYVPKERIDDVIYIDPTDRNFPIGFNPLEPVEDYESRQHLSTFFIAIFKKLFAATWNSRMEHLIRYVTLALLETPDSNILGIPRMLSDVAYRQRVIKQIQDPVVKAFWTNEFSASDGQFSSEAVVPILNKVGQFISNPIVRNIVGQRKNVLHFDEFMNEGKIVIINLSKGKLGDENTALLGSMFITKIQQAALARAKVSEDQRRDFYFYVDEFQNFATDAFSSILSEARKYHLNLTIAHQYMGQLPPDVRATAFGNVGTMITFAVGGDDAAYLSKEFSPTFSADDMINLNTREMYVKMSIDGKITPPFSAYSLNVPETSNDYTQQIIDASRKKYAQNKTKVENDIARWAENSESIESSNDGSFPEPII